MCTILTWHTERESGPSGRRNARKSLSHALRPGVRLERHEVLYASALGMVSKGSTALSLPSHAEGVDSISAPAIYVYRV